MSIHVFVILNLLAVIRNRLEILSMEIAQRMVLLIVSILIQMKGYNFVACAHYLLPQIFFFRLDCTFPHEGIVWVGKELLVPSMNHAILVISIV